jgi:phage gp45-like
MKPNEIIEILISIKDNYNLRFSEREAINATCNLLEKKQTNKVKFNTPVSEEEILNSCCNDMGTLD